MYRTSVIVRHTFHEAIVQPIYALLIGLDVILLFVLIATLFATSKSIFDEIEDRTMLTLMSKPVAKWEVLIGKYLGIVLAAFVAIVVLGFILILCTWWRIPGDYMMRANTLDERE